MSKTTSLLESERGMQFLTRYRETIDAVHLDVIGLDTVIQYTLTAMLAGGHVLLEGDPGVGKTLLIKTVARAINATCKRIQFSPETYPSDMYYSFESLKAGKGSGRTIAETVLAPGPIFTQILVGDEINRAPPRVHAPLLEPLEEGTVTLEGVSHDVGDLYFLLATQNPVETVESTNELPEALRERIMMLCHVPYASDELLRKIAVWDTRRRDIPRVLEVADIVAIREAIFVEYVLSRTAENDGIISYIQRLVTALHKHPATSWGPGVRAVQDLARASAVHAFLNGRSAISFDDVRAIALPTLRFKFARKTRESRVLGIKSNDQLIKETLQWVSLAEEQ